MSKRESKTAKTWRELEILSQPTVGQMDHLLGQLLALPPEPQAGASWHDVLHRFSQLKHPDLPGVFRRIAAAVPHTQKTGMAIFYWAAAGIFTQHGLPQMLPEVATGFRRLDAGSYDADALVYVEDYLMAGDFEAEALALAERFLPIERADDTLMPDAVPQQCNLIFELRAGRALRDGASHAASPDALARDLRQDIEKEIHEDIARQAATIATDSAPVLVWTRPQFDLVAGDISTDDKAWQDCQRMFGMLVRVAQEAWHHDARPPGCALQGLTHMLKSVFRWKYQCDNKMKNSGDNLLDYLDPSSLEGRLVESCRSMININEPRAWMFLDAHTHLLHSAARHELLTPAEIAQTGLALSSLRRKLDECV